VSLSWNGVNRCEMPTRPPRECLHPRCHELTTEGNYCEKHRSPYEKGRPSANDRGYDWHWYKVSKRYRMKHPVCEACNSAPTECTDHIIPLVEGGDKYAEENLQALCVPCHNAKTRRENP